MGNTLLSPEIAFLAYSIDSLIGEFNIKHPVSLMGDYIIWFEKRFYSNSIMRGGLLCLTLVMLSVSVVLLLHLVIRLLPNWSTMLLLGIMASTGIASKMLYDRVKAIITASDPNKALSYLVSRDTENICQSDIYKGAIETYAENISDGVIAPLFYLILFGVEGLFIYKSINTLDSMIGYRSPQYERFGRISARVDDLLNYIPARLSALLLCLISFQWRTFEVTMKYGSRHASPNAGYPISAMAGALDISLGGPTRYHGKLKDKAHFGNGRKIIEKKDVLQALAFKKWIDILIFGGLLVWILIKSL